MDSTAAVGTATKYAREDHVHPSDTSRASVSYVDSKVAALAPVTYVDAQDATKAPLVSPSFTGTPTAPTASIGTNTTQLATTAFVRGQAPFVDIRSYGAIDSSNVANRATNTTAIQNAINFAAANNLVVGMFGTYPVSHFTVPSNSKIIAGATLIGDTANTYSSVVELVDANDVMIAGRLIVSASYNTGYACGVKIWGNTSTCSLLDLSGICISGAYPAWQIGDTSKPDATVSEITISNGYTYGCPTAATVIGSQTFVNFNGYKLISGNNGGSGAWLSLPLTTIIALGSVITQTGGELLQTTSATSIAVELRPINSISYPKAYATYKAAGVAIESAGYLALMSNPSAVATVAAGRGGVTFEGSCFGVVTGNSTPVVAAAADFTGLVAFGPCGIYQPTTARTQPTIACSGNADVHCHEGAFGLNFPSALTGISGGVRHFSYRQIINAFNLVGQAIPGSTTTALKYQALDNSGDRSSFASCYSTTTGIFTVPAGGFTSVFVTASFTLGALTNAQLVIFVNGVARNGAVMNVYGNVSASLGPMSAGDTIAIRVVNVGGATGAGSLAYDQMCIFASN
jgi:hypothetical protein